jgi:hypothetical protein
MVWVYARSRTYYVTPESSPDDRGMRQEVGPVQAVPFGDAPALAKALDASHRQSGKRRHYIGVTDDDPGPAGRAAGCKTSREFRRGLIMVTVKFDEGSTRICRWMYQRRGAWSTDGGPLDIPRMPGAPGAGFDYPAIAAAVISICV